MLSSLIGVIVVEKIAYSRNIFGEMNIIPSLPITKLNLEVAESIVGALALQPTSLKLKAK